MWSALKLVNRMLNTGVSFGLEVPELLIWMAMIFVGYIWYRERHPSLMLIMVGGGANLVMRIMYGGVIDNWSIGEMFYNNWADYLIVIGIVWYGYTCFVRR